MIQLSKLYYIFSLVVAAILFSSVDSSSAQVVMYNAPPAVYYPARPAYYYRPYYAPVPATYATYFAPQVPIVTAYRPIPAVSTYYMPALPIATSYVVPVRRVRRIRRYAVPVAVRPVYWMGY